MKQTYCWCCAFQLEQFGVLNHSVNLRDFIQPCKRAFNEFIMPNGMKVTWAKAYNVVRIYE